MRNKKVEAIDIFCGIGGLTYGLRDAGINVVAGLDNDKTCKFAYEKNTLAKFIEADVSNYDFHGLKSFFSEESTKILVGCAPCQPFSSHTYKARNKNEDKRWNLIDYFIKAIEVVKPDVVSMENVRGLTKTEVFRNFVNSLELMDYEVDYKVVYCPDYGIPQSRSRLVLIGSRIGKIKVPTKTHTKEEYLTVGDVIRDTPKIAAGEFYIKDPIHKAKNLSPLNIQRIKQSRPRGTWKDWDTRLLPDCYKRATGATYTSVYGRMDWDDVAPTITTQFFNYGSGRFGHPEQNRALSLREGAILQTFPKKYDFGVHLPISVLGRHIGNSVPPKLGYIIGNAIKAHIQGALYGG